jgi:hypothetical protein
MRLPQVLSRFALYRFFIALVCMACILGLLHQQHRLCWLWLWPEPEQASLFSPAQDTAFPHTAAACTDYQRQTHERLPMPIRDKSAHASTLIALPASHPLGAGLAVFWFAGSKEGAADVHIVGTWRTRSRSPHWQPPQVVVNRQDLQRSLGMGIRRLGNPVAWVDGQHRVHLWVVGTGLGGWAASRLIHLIETEPFVFEPESVLPLAPLVPFWGTSHLVRNPPLPLSDGGAWLPVYFELGNTYGLALRLDAKGHMQAIRPLTAKTDSLQPSLVALSPTHWVAFMRDHGPAQQVHWSQTQDAGAHWQDGASPLLSNPDSALAAVRLNASEVWIANNPDPEGRSILRWSIWNLFKDPQARALRHRVIVSAPVTQVQIQTQTHTQIPSPPPKTPHEFSYPSVVLENSLAMSCPGLWLSYTDERQAIAIEKWEAHAHDPH